MKNSPLLGFAMTALMLSACGLGTELEEHYEGYELATVDTFEVADSSLADSIRVRLAGTIGQTTAYSFDRIDFLRTDTLFQIAVWGKWRESSREEYVPAVNPFDTTLVFQSPLRGLHYIDVYASNGTLRDSTVVY